MVLEQTVYLEEEENYGFWTNCGFEIKRDYVFSDGGSGSGGGGRLAVVEVMAVVETEAVVLVNKSNRTTIRPLGICHI